MSYAHLTELRLTAFKSFRDQVLPIDPTTILIGRNGSGKSNALDALDVLARLANADDVKDALEPVRGGAAGCAPHGTNSFSLGCTVSSYLGTHRYDVDVQVRPQPIILRERISLVDGDGNRVVSFDHSSDDAQRKQSGQRRQSESTVRMYASIFSAAKDVPAEYFSDDSDEEEIDDPQLDLSSAAIGIAEALRSVFHIEPDPPRMRAYVSETDHQLRRDGANVSAALEHMASCHIPRLGPFEALIGAVSDLDVAELGFSRTDLGDVMLLVSEKVGRSIERTPARELSDGILRLAAVGAALLSERDDLDLPASLLDQPFVTFVMEEIDNGLHPAQARRVLDLLRHETSEQGNRVVLTTHNPALLDAATGQINQSVIVCYRDKETGRSVLSRVTDLPGYARAMTVGGIGDAVTQGRLAGPEVRSTDDSVLRGILGIDV